MPTGTRRSPTATHYVVALLAVLVVLALWSAHWDRALTYALVAFVLLLADDGRELRRRVRELEATVDEIIES